MGKYVFLRLLNYVVLLFIAVNLTYFLAASQLHPRILFLAVNPPLDPVSVDNTLYAYNLNDKTPIVERWWAWLTGVFLHWDWGFSPRGDSVNNQINQRVWVSLRLILIGSIAAPCWACWPAPCRRSGSTSPPTGSSPSWPCC